MPCEVLGHVGTPWTLFVLLAFQDFTPPALTGTLPKYDLETFYAHSEYVCRIWGGTGWGLRPQTV